MSDIFLSYARQDIERVRPIVEALEGGGWSVWWDRALKPGETWPDVIEKQLKRARCVVVAWSSASIQSPWVRMEANKARERGVLVPLLLEQVQVPPEFGSVQAVTLSVDEVEDHAALVDGVRTLLRRRSYRRGFAAALVLGVSAALLGAVSCLRGDSCSNIFSLAPPDRSIAVLDFENGLGDEQVAGITDAFIDELRETLASVDGQPVAARAAIRALPRDLTPIEIGARLRVRWLVAGAVSGSGNRLEFSAELIDASSGYMHDSLRYSFAVSDLEGMRRAIAGDVLGALGVDAPFGLRERGGGSQSSSEAYVLYLSGKAALRRNNYPEAEAFFDRAQALEPGFPEAEGGLCRVHLARFEAERDSQEFDVALRHCSNALSAAGNSADAALALGQLHLLSGDTVEATSSFSRALELNESSADALIGMARAAEAQGASEQAERYLRESIAAQRGYWRPFNELGIFLLGRGRMDEALASFNDALALAPEDPAILNNLAAVYAMNGQFAGAAEAWSRVLAVEPQATAYGNLGSAHYWAGNLQEAVAMYERAVELQPEDFRWWSSLGDALLHVSGRDAAPVFRRALEQTDQELRINPDNVRVRVGRAAILAALDDDDAAHRVLVESEHLIARNPELAYLAAVAALRLGDLSAAERYAAIAREQGYPEVLMRADPTFRPLGLVQTGTSNR